MVVVVELVVGSHMARSNVMFVVFDKYQDK